MSGSIGERFDPIESEQRFDPYEFFGRARREQPVFYSPRFDVWVVTRYDDICEVVRQPGVFSNATALRAVTPIHPDVFGVLRDYPMTTSLPDADPPDHQRLRKLLNPSFSSARIARLRPQIQHIVDQLIDGFIADRAAELVSQFCFPLPQQVVFHLIGVPREDAAQVAQWAQSWAALLLAADATVAEQTRVAQDMVAVARYLRELVERRRRAPADDVATDLVRAHEADPELLPIDRVVHVLCTLLPAGFETTASLLSTGLRHLLSHPDQLALLRADPALIGNAVEELLRYDSSVVHWQRVTTREAVLGGVAIPAGGRVLLAFGSANRDEAHFSDPDTLDIQRDNAAHHLSFSKGVHHCIGAPLGRLETVIALDSLLTRLPGLRLRADQAFDYAKNFLVRQLDALHVEWD